MSFIRTGGRRARVGVLILSLVAFQALAMIGAGVASAVTGCTFNPATNTINITIDPTEFAGVAVEDASDLDPESPPGAILFDNNGAGFDNGAASTQCGSASNTLTTSIVVLGSPSADEYFYIENGGGFIASDGAPFNSAIVWAIDMGSQSLAGFDQVDIFGNDDVDDEIVLTNGNFTMNGAAGTWLGVEYTNVRGTDGDDVIDASAVTSIITDLHGGFGDDFIAPGTQATLPFVLFEEDMRGGVGFDTLSYGTRTTSVVIDNSLGVAGHSANADCDVADPGDEADDITDFEVLVSGSAADCLVGAAGVDEVFVPGDGDDDITGNGGDDDALDYSSSSAAMTIDPALGTATGQGTDTFADVQQFFGSAFDDVLLWDGTTTGFAGGDGIDTVDASAQTTGQSIDLDDLDDIAGEADSTENVIGGSANDDLEGNDIRNEIDGGAGDDDLFGDDGNDTLIGGLGNDNFEGGSGADRVRYSTNTTNGVNVDVNLGFATSAESGDDSFVDTIEIINGSPFRDSITGGGGIIAINFIFSGAAGNDRLTGSGSNDTLRGGAGNDRMRGLEGGDTIRGGPGARDRAWGGPGVDFCKAEFERGCE